MTEHKESGRGGGNEEGSSGFHTHRPIDLFRRISETKSRGDALIVGVRAMRPELVTTETIDEGFRRLANLTKGLRTTVVAIDPEPTFMNNLDSTLPGITSSKCLGSRWPEHESELLKKGVQLIFTDQPGVPLIVGPYIADPVGDIAHSTMVAMSHAVEAARAFSF